MRLEAASSRLPWFSTELQQPNYQREREKKRTVEEKNIVGNEFDFQNFSWKSAVIDSEKKDAFSAVRVRAGAPSLALSKLYCAKMPTTMQTETCWLLLSNTKCKFYWISLLSFPIKDCFSNPNFTLIWQAWLFVHSRPCSNSASE